MNDYGWSDLQLGMSCSFDAVVTEAMMERFLGDTGDSNPLHVDGGFARSRGFEGRVVYGMLAASFYSTLVGVHLPGRNALLHGIDVDFHKPIYPGMALRIRGEVVQLLEAYKRVELRASISTMNDEILSKAKIRVGLHG